MTHDPYRPPEIPTDANLPVADMSGEVARAQTRGIWFTIVVAVICVIALGVYYTNIVKEPRVASHQQTPVANATH